MSWNNESLTVALYGSPQSRTPEHRLGRRGSKKLRAMETYEKQTNWYQLCLLLFNNNVDLKNNKRNHRKFVSIWSWQTIKLPMMLLWKRRLCPRCSPFEIHGGNASAIRRPCLPLSAVTISLHYLPICLHSSVTCGKTPHIVTWSEY